jgi:signal transduction histidine kinase
VSSLRPAQSWSWARSNQALDVALAFAAWGASVAVLARGGLPLSNSGAGQLDAASVLLTACASLPLLGWRRSPIGVFAATAAASIVLGGLGYRVGLPIGPAVALYLLAASRRPEHRWRRLDTAVVLVALAAFLVASGLAAGAFPDGELLHTGLAWAVAWLAGERTRLRREQIAELHDRALRAEREAERDRRLALAEERARIARDLHDSAGHAINVIAVRASAARLRHETEPERSRLALEAIEELARGTAEEIDAIVHSLRDRDSTNGSVVAPPSLASLETLAAHHVSSGLEVAVEAKGKARPLAPATDLAAYRIVQEALTNAARHGTGAAQVELAFGLDALELTVTNPVPTRARTRSVGGHGLIGMRERAGLLGGTLDAGRVDGTFRVHAHLPYVQQGLPA